MPVSATNPSKVLRSFRYSSSSLPAWLFLLVGALSYAQPPGPDSDIATDRPDITESSIVVPKGSLQIENGGTWTTDSSSSSHSFDISESLIRLGLTRRTEFRIVAPNYLGGITGLNPTGFGDIAVGIKHQIGPLPGGVDLSVILAVSLPTGSRQVSSHGYDPYVKFPWSKELKDGWSVGGMQSLFWTTAGSRRNGIWEPTFYIEKEITKPWEAFAEYAGDYSQFGPPRQIAHFGTAYKITRRQLVDFHFGFGLSQAAPSHFFALGYSFRIDNLFGRR